MPYDPRLLIALLVGCAALQVAFDVRHGSRPGLIAATLLGGLAVVGVVFVLLRSRGKPERFVQTASALAAVYLVYGIAIDLLALALPLDAWAKAWEKHLEAHSTELPALPVTGLQTFVAFVILALVIWRLCVWIRILRRALEVTLAGGVLLFVLLVIVDLVVGSVAAALIGAA